jgi:NADPH:quinone reductase-like Zn-dependent oxidoreductase
MVTSCSFSTQLLTLTRAFPALQLAKLSGFSPIIAVASPTNFALVKSLGATHTVDRKLVGSLTAEVAKITAEPVQYAYDAWGDEVSQQATYDVLAPGGRLALVQPNKVKEADGKNANVLFVQGVVHVPANHKLAISLFGAIDRLLQDGTIKAKRFTSSLSNAVEVIPGGLGGIPEGLALLAAEKVSGKKLVVKPQETA